MRKRGNVLLLMMFMLAFVTSIVGLLYSYNKRIILISRQEQDNYRKSSLKFREALTDLYLVYKFKNVEGDNLPPPIDLITFETNPDINDGNFSPQTVNLTQTWEDENANPPRSQGFQGPTFKINAGPYSTTEDLQEEANRLTNNRLEYFTNAAKREIQKRVEDYIKQLLQSSGIEVKEIRLVREDLLQGLQENKYILKYQLVTEIKDKDGKRKIRVNEFTVEYSIKIKFTMYYESSGGITTPSSRQDPIYDIYGNIIGYRTIYTHQANITATIKARSKMYASLIGMGIKSAR